MRHWRWAVVVAGTASLAAVPVVAARWPVDDPRIDATELAEAVRDSADQPFVGLVESRGGLRLPDLGRYDDEVAPFTQRTRSRIWYAGPDLWRASELLVGGERGTYRDPMTLWTWDSGDRDVERVPRAGDEPLRLPRVMDLAPAELGRRLVLEAGTGVGTMSVEPIGSRRVAGRVAAGLRLSPSDPAMPTTVDHVDLWAVPTTGVVLAVEIFTGDGPPVFQTAFVEVDFVRPDDAAVRFPVADATAAFRIEDRTADPIEIVSAVPFATFPDDLGGLPRRTPSGRGVATYGSGFQQVTAVAAPSGSLGRRLSRLPRTARPWGGDAVVVSTSLVNAQVVTTAGLDVVLAGTITVAELDRLMEDLLVSLGSIEGST